MLARLGIRCLGDLVLHLPRRFLDRGEVRSIGSLEPLSRATVTGTVTHLSERRLRGGRRLLQAFVSDGTGVLALSFFNSAWMRSRLPVGSSVTASGEVVFLRGPVMTHPDLLVPGEEAGGCPPASLLPVYPLTSGITQGVMRRIIDSALDSLPAGLRSVLPEGRMAMHGFASRRDLLVEAHRPSSASSAGRARRTLALEEIFLHQHALARVREAACDSEGIRVPLDGSFLPRFLGGLGFGLTRAQERSTNEILSDMAGPLPMRRLLQGDVGSGKTVVAAAACALACTRGMQAVLLAPTEVLASQHLRTLQRLTAPLGIACRQLSGGTPARERRALLEELASGAPVLLTGTHAVLEPPVELPGLALVVVDEQHRFGVAQREELMRGRLRRPHLLVMSATPIPRTLTMAFYGDLDLSVLDELPPGRGRTMTELIGEEDRRRAYEVLRERLEAGERAYIVYPLREASEKQDLKDATTAWERIAAGPLGRFGAGLIHGSMPAARKVAAADDFASGRTRVLVSTTVVEVGLDVPEATVLIVSDAERFGLSQLHQLRGRIGRGSRDSWCFLVSGEDAGESARMRLAAMVGTSDGFELARRDLEIRGPGDILGTRQSGLPEFRVADLATDGALVSEASELVRTHSPGPGLEEELVWRYKLTQNNMI